MTTTIQKGFTFRLYPNKKQEILIAKTIGCGRFVYNHFLSLWNETYEKTGKGLSYAKCSALCTVLKASTPWLKEVDAHALQSSLKDLGGAFDKFFKKQNAYPRFKRRPAGLNPIEPISRRIISFRISALKAIDLNSRSLVGFVLPIAER